jgi:hypothetical protein
MGQCLSYSRSCLPCKNNVVQSVLEKTTQKVTYEIALKAPNSFNCQYASSNINKWIFGDDISLWIQNLYHDKKYTNWMLYNDQVSFEPHDKQTYIDLISTRNDGHCKGIVAWNKDMISWLVHSVPDYPQFFDGNKISKIPESKKIYGQSFVHICMPYDDKLIDDIQNQLHIMHANMFICNCYDEYKDKYKKKEREIKKTVHIDDNIKHIAKSKKFGNDIYEHYLMKEFSGNNIKSDDHCLCQTWIRGYNYPDSNIVKHVKIVKWTTTDIKYSLSKDHSKWCISQIDDKNKKWVYVGDINRMTSQKNRGGGGIVVVDDDLHELFNKLCIKE